MDFWTIWNAVQPELIVVALAAVGGGASYLYQWGVQRLPAAMRSHMADLTDTTVRAIEQKYSAGSPGGDIKKQEAMQLLLSLCQGLHISLNTIHASAAIEAAVYELNLMSGKPAPATTTEKPTAIMPSVTTAAKSSAASKPLAAG